MAFNDGLLLTGGIHRVAPIDQQPHVRLINWSIKEMNEGKFFVGETSPGYGRVSTDIVELDLEKKRGVTASGRVYELVGESRAPGPDASYVWNHYKSINRLTELEVTEGIGAC